MDLVASYLTALGLTGVAAGMFLESLGVPCFPGGLIIIFAGFLISQDRLEFETVLLTAFAAYTLGSVIAYVIGKHFGESFFARFGHWIGAVPQRYLNAETTSVWSAGALIVLGRFIPGLGNLAPYAAGLLKLKVGWFLLYNSFFAVVWSVVYLYVGMFFGHRWPVIIEFIQPRMLGFAILGILLFLSFLALRDRKRMGLR